MHILAKRIAQRKMPALSRRQARVLIGSGCCMGLAVAAFPACARDSIAPVVPAAAQLLPVNFDLSVKRLDREADLAGSGTIELDEEKGALGAPANPRQPWVDDGLKREWSIQPVADGPALEVVALGGGKKKAGRLAHIRVSWAW